MHTEYDGYKELASAIIFQAVEDWYHMIKDKTWSPDAQNDSHKRWDDMIREARRSKARKEIIGFLTTEAEQFTDLDCCFIIKKLLDDYAKDDCKMFYQLRKERRYNERRQNEDV